MLVAVSLLGNLAAGTGACIGSGARIGADDHALVVAVAATGRRQQGGAMRLDDEYDDGEVASGEAPTPLHLDGVLDLHMFLPRDVKDLVPAYLEQCRAAGLLDVRIVHGKGIGVLREIVRGILAEHPDVERFGHGSDAGSWGATWVRLKPPPDPQ